MNIIEQLRECEELYEKNDYRGLIEKCDWILDEYPDCQNAMGYKGIAHCFFGEYDEALEVLERGVELYPENYYLKNNLAMVHYGLGDYERSLRLCDEGLKIKDFDWLVKNKFKCLIKLGRLDEAIEFEKSNDNRLSSPLMFLDDDIREHELEYYKHVLKGEPDNFAVREMIKMLEAHQS